MKNSKLNGTLRGIAWFSCSLCAALAPFTAFAQWSDDPATNNAIGVAGNTRQVAPQILSDGNHGAIIVWADERNIDSDLYGQRLDASGTAAWSGTGLRLTLGEGRQECPALVAHAGGIVIAWRDSRTNSSINEIFVQKFNLAGQSLWAFPTLAHQANNFAPAVLVSSQSGIITASYTSSLFDDVISLQIIDGDGMPRFFPQQRIINNNAQGRQPNLPPTVAPGLGGGVIASWVDSRNDTTLFVSGLSSAGSIWSAGEVAVGEAVTSGTVPAIIQDGNEGAIVIWLQPSGPGTDDLKASRLDRDGSQVWSPPVRTIASSSGKKQNLRAVDIGGGAAYLVWQNSVEGNNRIFGQRLANDGSAWGSDVQLALNAGNQVNPDLAIDLDGEALVTWEDDRNIDVDIYAQSLDPSGARKWTETGVAVSTATGTQQMAAITNDGLGGAIVTWEDHRTGDPDVFAQRVSKTGVLGEFRTLTIMTALRNAAWEVGSSRTISWTATAEIDSVRIELSRDGGQTYDLLFDALPNSTPENNRVTISIPGPAAAQAVLRLSVVEAPFIRSESEVFTLTAPVGPEVNLTPVSVASAGDSLAVVASATDLSGVQELRLTFRRGGAGRFDSVQMERTGPGQFAGQIPGGFVTERGLEYYIAATDSIGSVSNSDTFSTVVSFTAGVQSAGLTRGFEQSSYSMLAAPNLLVQPRVDSIFAASGFGAPDTTSWRLFEYQDSTNVELDSLNGGSFHFDPGKAYWVISAENRTVNFGSGRSLPPDDDASVALTPGWNQVANPFAFSVSWDDVVVASGDPLVSRPYAFRGTYVQADVLTPYEGYFVFNFESQNVELLFPPVEAADDDSTLSKLTFAPGWELQIEASCKHAADSQNFLGVHQDAAVEWDRLDQPEPPTIGEFVSVYFPHDDWQRFSNNYNSDYRPQIETGTSWTFVARSNIRNAEVKLEFSGLEKLPAGLKVMLYDPTLNFSSDLAGSSTFSFASGARGVEKSFTLLVGTTEYIADNIGTNLLPTKFELAQNFPNPFNPSTTIRYGLPAEERVTLKIYNLLGREIRTILSDEPKAAGFHLALWDGRDKQNRLVGSGVYIYQIIAGEFKQTRKMLLVK